MDKKQLRSRLRNSLSRLTESQRSDMSKKACRALIDTEHFRRASVIMLFLSLPREIDTTAAILNAWQNQKIVVVPKVSPQQKHMIPIQIHSLESGISTDQRGLRNPVTGPPVPPEDIQLVVTPGLAFDKNGNRLGRGASYYDRFFAAKQLNAAKCGFAFSCQIMDDVPVENHDQKVDMLVTDKEIIYCNNNCGG
jgi:5-formyltetrahydrofolate cyclo-ligase